MAVKVGAPELLAVHHDTALFDSGEPALDEWLHHRALANQQADASRTYVITRSPAQVVGYYALASGSIVAAEAPGRIRRNMPNPIPVMVLGRLAVDRSLQGQGIGQALLRDAILRTVQAADIVGIRAIVVHALHDRAAAFYRHAGFQPSPLNEHTLMLLLNDVRATIDAR